MVKKKSNDTYEVLVKLEDHEVDGNIISGDFTVELFEKNYGTFEEDAKLVMNINEDNVLINGKKDSLSSLNASTKEKLKNEIASIAFMELNKFHYGE